MALLVQHHTTVDGRREHGNPAPSPCCISSPRAYLGVRMRNKCRSRMDYCGTAQLSFAIFFAVVQSTATCDRVICCRRLIGGFRRLMASNTVIARIDRAGRNSSLSMGTGAGHRGAIIIYCHWMAVIAALMAMPKQRMHWHAHVRRRSGSVDTEPATFSGLGFRVLCTCIVGTHAVCV